jgi:hypothetical protein
MARPRLTDKERKTRLAASRAAAAIAYNARRRAKFADMG